MADPTKNPFEQLNTNLREVPPEMRKKVMNDVAIAKLVLDMAIMFTANYSSIFSSFLRSNKRKNT